MPRVRTVGGVEPVLVQAETILVKGEAPRIARILRTSRGPVLSMKGDTATVMHWAGYDFPAWAVVAGPRRMADDPLAPSRSYLKVEEAYAVLGVEPRPGEQVCDLGAAPGGWSYSAARRGARVIAVDNGPLKGGALGHPHIDHRREDAFRFHPAPGETFDWLFCDLVEEPHHVLADLVTPWLARGWCRRFIVNLKFGRVDPVRLLRELRAPEGPLARHAPGARVLHLFHDREEFTVVGAVAGLAPAPAAASA
jgi:23S rRNA (cytidine2498-2'-O)-methyltransferase